MRLLHVAKYAPIPGLRNLHPGYSSVLVKFDALQTTHAEIEAALRAAWTSSDVPSAPDPRTVVIPALYDGPDLADVAQLHGLSVPQVIEIHASVTYLTYFLGFAPGFAYLGEVDPRIATPRLASPRKSVPAGSIGIAGNQTGVYPISTPGGWRLIARTSIPMFRTDHWED